MVAPHSSFNARQFLVKAWKKSWYDQYISNKSFKKRCKSNNKTKNKSESYSSSSFFHCGFQRWSASSLKIKLFDGEGLQYFIMGHYILCRTNCYSLEFILRDYQYMYIFTHQYFTAYCINMYNIYLPIQKCTSFLAKELFLEYHFQ